MASTPLKFPPIRLNSYWTRRRAYAPAYWQNDLTWGRGWVGTRKKNPLLVEKITSVRNRVLKALSIWPGDENIYVTNCREPTADGQIKN
jgi:hypothetical protein